MCSAHIINVGGIGWQSPACSLNPRLKTGVCAHIISDRIPNTNNDSASGNDNTTTSISEDGTQSQRPNVSPEAAPDTSIDDVTTDATQDRATEADARATTNTTEKYPNGIWADQPHEAEPNGQRQTDARRSPQGDTPATSATERPQQRSGEGRGSEPVTPLSYIQTQREGKTGRESNPQRHRCKPGLRILLRQPPRESSRQPALRSSMPQCCVTMLIRT